MLHSIQSRMGCMLLKSCYSVASRMIRICNSGRAGTVDKGSADASVNCHDSPSQER